MMIDDWNSGVLSPDDPWAMEALKRGLIQPRKPIETRSISPNPPEPGRNLAEPYLPGTKAFTKRVDEWQPPNPLTTKVGDNPLLMGAVGLTEMWHGYKYPKTFKGFRLEGDPQKWGAVQYSQIDKGGNAAPITFYVKPGQDLETRLAEVLAKFGKKE